MSFTDEHRLSQRAEDPIPYAIYPKDAANKGQTDAITKLLNELVSDKEKNIRFREQIFGDTLLERPFDEAAGHDGEGQPICLIYCDGDTAPEKRDGGIVRQRDAVPEMVLISTPEWRKHDKLKDYVYDRAAGTDQRVYVCDYGAHLDNSEFTDGANIKAKARWFSAHGQERSDMREDDGSPLGYGSCMLDKVGGNKFGVAKIVSPVLVKIPYGGRPEGFLDSIQKVHDDWKPKYDADPRHATAVVSMSWGYSDALLEEGVREDWKDALKRLLQKLVPMGVLPVTGSGNGKPGNQPVDRYPQLWAAKPSDVPELLVVGGVTNEGKLWDRSNVADFVKVHSLSFEIPCVDGKGGLRNHREVTGTSQSAATVAGLAAYFLGLSSLRDELGSDTGVQKVRKLKSFITQWAYPRDDGLPMALWNLMDPLECGVIRRDNGAEEPCDSGVTRTKYTVVEIPGCFITTKVAIIGSLRGITMNQH